MTIAERLAEIQKLISKACAKSGRSVKDAHILAVSKFQPAELIEEAYHLGLRDFGENYVQELLDKQERLKHLKDIRWHLIGHLQTNKLKQALQADYFHALDSEKLIHEISKKIRYSERRQPWPVFIQVNLDHEQTKAGVSPEEVPHLIELARKEPMLKLEGLMCIPEPKDTIEEMRPAFKRLAKLAEPGMKLSMGMSEDFEIAIEEGAHWVRIGRRLFGERPSK